MRRFTLEDFNKFKPRCKAICISRHTQGKQCPEVSNETGLCWIHRQVAQSFPKELITI